MLLATRPRSLRHAALGQVHALRVASAVQQQQLHEHELLHKLRASADIFGTQA